MNDADALDGECDGEIVCEAGDAGEAEAGFELDFELSDDGAGIDANDADDAAVFHEGFFEEHGAFLELGLVFALGGGGGFEDIEGGELERATVVGGAGISACAWEGVVFGLGPRALLGVFGLLKGWQGPPSVGGGGLGCEGRCGWW